jgi:Fatty acid hydroxylase superfamily
MEQDIFSYKYLVVFLWLTLGKLLTVSLFTAISNLPSKRAIRFYNIEVSSEQTHLEMQSSWLVILDPLFLTLLIWFGWLKLAPESLGTFLLTMHQSNLLWKIHQRHHISKVTQPQTAFSFSFLEKFTLYTCGCFLFLALVSQFIPISLYGIVALYTYYDFISGPLGHANTEIEIFPSWLPKLPFGLSKFLGTSSDHALHHQRYNVNLGFLTPIMDRIFGTYQPGSDALAEDLALDNGLANLSK